MSESIMLNKSKDFAVDVVKACRSVKSNDMTRQLIRSGTSIGANIHESKYAQGTADFISKMQIALKECYESEYWLEILNRVGDFDEVTYKKLSVDCGNIRRMLISSINTVKKNNSK